MTREEILKLVSCPTCSAGKGESCLTLQKQPMNLMHLRREARAKRVRESSLALMDELKKGV